MPASGFSSQPRHRAIVAFQLVVWMRTYIRAALSPRGPMSPSSQAKTPQRMSIWPIVLATAPWHESFSPSAGIQLSSAVANGVPGAAKRRVVASR